MKVFISPSGAKGEAENAGIAPLAFTKTLILGRHRVRRLGGKNSS
jgi:hypothetical protein